MKKFSKLLFSLVSLFLLFNLTACFTAYNSDTEEELVALSINTENEAFRTILPLSSNFTSMAKYELKGKKLIVNESTKNTSYSATETIKTWTSYSSFYATKEIFCKPGVWTFTLYSYDKSGAETYSGTITDYNVSSTASSKTLSFKMKSSSIYGKVKVTMYFPADESVKGIKAYLTTTVGGSKNYTSTLTKKSGTENNVNKNYVVYEPSSSTISTGTYYVCFDFYRDADCTDLIQTNMELVNIYPGETSTAVREITHIKHVYKIYYNLNGGGFDPSTKIITTFSEYDNITLPTPRKNGSISIMYGEWYLKSDFSGEPITGWTSGTYNSDVTLYAKWN